MTVGACMAEEDDATVATVRENLGAMEDCSNPRCKGRGMLLIRLKKPLLTDVDRWKFMGKADVRWAGSCWPIKTVILADDQPAAPNLRRQAPLSRQHTA